MRISSCVLLAACTGSATPGADRLDDTAACTETTWYPDADHDGYGVPDGAVTACEAPDGYVADATDCDDDHRHVHPGATEECDDLDGDCNGVVDDTDLIFTWYADDDGDGFGDPDDVLEDCRKPPGYVEPAGDCDDSDATANPSGREVCGNGVDDDCVGGDRACAIFGDVDVDAADLTWVGATENAGLGSVVTDAGDVDGDGRHDLLLAADRDGGAAPTGGAVYLLLGPASSSSGVVSGEVVFRGDNRGDHVGATAVGAGDIDGDGHADLAIGAYRADPATVFLAYGPLTGEIFVSDLPDRLTGERTAYFGSRETLAAGADLDGDGLDDLAVGAPGGSSSNGICALEASVAVSMGPLSGTVDASSASAVFAGVADYDCFGSAVTFGDFDGDGVKQLIVGARGDGTEGDMAGAVWIWEGPPVAGTIVEDVTDRWTGAREGDWAGHALDAGGDIDGDGYVDLLVGAPKVTNDDGTGVGAAYVLRGPEHVRGSLEDAAAILVGTESGEQAGWAVNNDGGDVDADGQADILIGSPRSGTSTDQAGVVWLVLGMPSGVVDLGTVDARFAGEQARGWLGSSIATLPDQDGDGYDEIVLGAREVDTGEAGAPEGAAYLFFGRSSLYWTTETRCGPTPRATPPPPRSPRR